jgi:hypothetical protein
VSGPPDEPQFDVAGLLALPEPLATRVVRLALYRIMGSEDAAPWTREAVRSILDLARAVQAGAGTSRTDRRPDASGSMFPSLALPPRPGVKGGEMEGRVVLSSSRTPSRSVRRCGGDARERDIERILITEQQIQDKLRELGEQITRDYEGRELLLLGVSRAPS